MKTNRRFPQVITAAALSILTGIAAADPHNHHHPRQHDTHVHGAQQQQVTQVLQQLQRYQAVARFSGADCTQTGITLESPFGKLTDTHRDTHEKQTHTEFHVTYRLACSAASRIDSVTVTVFNQFPGFDSVAVPWLTPTRQGAGTASPSQPVVRLQ